MNWIEQVRAAKAAGNLEAALKILDSELAKRPTDPQVHYQIAGAHDSLGKEADAVPSYLRAIELGLPAEDLKSAYLCLGSTYRCLGEYEKSNQTFERGIELFPEDRALKVFRSLTLYNLGEPRKAIETLLIQLIETTSDPSIQLYKRALTFYSDKLDDTFE